MKLLGQGSIFRYLGSTRGVTITAITIIVISALIVIARLTKLNVFGVVQKALHFLLRISSHTISKSEKSYHRDLEVGKITDKNTRVKNYKFLNDLIIDLGLKSYGATPYEFLFICLVGSLVGALILCSVLFGNVWMTIIMFPIVLAGTLCILYTKANIAHDARIENVIDAENIICNNIKDGVIVAVRTSLDVIPISIRPNFRDFLDNIEHKNYHIKTALEELNNQLGVVADDFIKKCIVFETEEEHGIVGMFQDVVKINNIKMEVRTDMKRKFEEVTTDFIIGASMIFVFLGGVLAIYPNVAHFYLKTVIGQLIIALDILILIGEFVYITYLRAKEI